MAAAYVFCLVLGGGLAALSAFGDLFGDGDIPVDVDADLDVDGLSDIGDALTTDADIGYVASVFSIRSLIFAVLGFGATGSLLTFLGASADAPSTLGLSIGAGALVGVSVGAFLGYLKRSDTGPRSLEGSYAGLTGRVTLPLADGAPGRIRVTRGDREYSVRALPFRGDPASTTPPEEWTRVMVVEMRDGVAYVQPLDDENARLLDSG